MSFVISMTSMVPTPLIPMSHSSERVSPKETDGCPPAQTFFCPTAVDFIGKIPHAYGICTYRTYIHTYIRTYIRTYVHTYVHTCVHIYIYMYCFASNELKRSPLLPSCTHIYMYIHISICIYIYIYVYIHTYPVHMNTAASD